MLVALGGFARIADREVVREVEARQVWLRRGGRHTRHLAVGKVRDAIDGAESSPARDLGVYIQVGVAGQAQSDEERRGQRDFGFRMVGETERPVVLRVEARMILADRSGLRSHAPALVLCSEGRDERRQEKERDEQAAGCTVQKIGYR